MTDKDENMATMRKLKFRNYQPRSEELKKYMEEMPAVSSELHREQKVYKQAIDAAAAQFADPATDFQNIAPKKVNWDIEKAIAPKLKMLEKRTQKALLEIARQRAFGKTEGEKLAASVSNAAELSSEEEDEYYAQ